MNWQIISFILCNFKISGLPLFQRTKYRSKKGTLEKRQHPTAYYWYITVSKKIISISAEKQIRTPPEHALFGPKSKQFWILESLAKLRACKNSQTIGKSTNSLVHEQPLIFFKLWINRDICYFQWLSAVRESAQSIQLSESQHFLKNYCQLDSTFTLRRILKTKNVQLVSQSNDF